MKLFDDFLKLLLKGRPDPRGPEYGYLTMESCLRLLEDPDYAEFSPRLKEFIQLEYKRLDAKQKLKSSDC